MNTPDTTDTFLDETLKPLGRLRGATTEESSILQKVDFETAKASIKQFIENRVKEARVDEINSWFDMPKHYPGEEYRDEPFAKVRCKAPNKVQYYTLDSTFTWCLKNRIAVLTESKGD